MQIQIKADDICKLRADLTILPSQLSISNMLYLSRFQSKLNPRRCLISLKFKSKDTDIVRDYSTTVEETNSVENDEGFESKTKALMDFDFNILSFKSIDIAELDLDDDNFLE